MACLGRSSTGGCGFAVLGTREAERDLVTQAPMGVVIGTPCLTPRSLTTSLCSKISLLIKYSRSRSACPMGAVPGHCIHSKGQGQQRRGPR